MQDVPLSENVNVKFGRNDRCWCGSGKKFKHCHLDRERLAPLTIEEISKGQKGAANLRQCLVQNLDPTPCSGPIVKAHSLSRKASLERISRQQHVYGFRWAFVDLLQNGGINHPQLVGIREASTFTGFCEGHDGRLFKEIDAEPLAPTRRQLGLLSYRALCQEIMAKRVLGRTVPFIRELDRGRVPRNQVRTQGIADGLSKHVAQSLPELSGEQKEWHETVVGATCEHLSYALIRLGSTPDVICSGVSQPRKDFNGRILLDLAKPGTRQDDVSFGLVPAEAGGFAFFAWLGHFAEAEELVGSLLKLPEERIADQLVRYSFETFANVWLSPEWWEGLSLPEQDFLIERMNIGGLPPYKAGTAIPYDLRDNGMRFVRWNITEVEATFN